MRHRWRISSKKKIWKELILILFRIIFKIFICKNWTIDSWKEFLYNLTTFLKFEVEILLNLNNTLLISNIFLDIIKSKIRRRVIIIIITRTFLNKIEIIIIKKYLIIPEIKLNLLIYSLSVSTQLRRVLIINRNLVE